MSYGNEEASTHRRDVRAVLPPETLDDSVHAHELHTEPPTRLRADATPATPYVQRSAVQPHAYEAPSHLAPSPRERTERSVHAALPAIAPLPHSRAARGTADVRAPKAAAEAPHPADVAAARRSSKRLADAARSVHSSSKTSEAPRRSRAAIEHSAHSSSRTNEAPRSSRAVVEPVAHSAHSSSRTSEAPRSSRAVAEAASAARGSSRSIVEPAPLPASLSPYPAPIEVKPARAASPSPAQAASSSTSASKSASVSASVSASKSASKSASVSASKSVSKSAPKPAPQPAADPKLARGSSRSVVEPTPTPPAADAAAAAAAAASPGPAPAVPGMIDPMLITLPPELGPSIYGWVRRLALQADLQTADRVLRDALLEISSSLSVAIVYPGQDGLWTLGSDDEVPRDASPIIACAQARRALIASHTALIPILTTSETVGVIILTRNPRNPGYLPVEQIAMIGLARESASILHHLAVQHLQKATEVKADKGSLYRGEALEAHRSKGNEGALVQLSPSWVKRAYPLLVGALVTALLFSIFITVPTYSTGSGFVAIDGATVSAQQGGTVDAVLVAPGQAVVEGTAIVRLSAQAEVDELTAARTEHNGTLQQMLFDATDEQLKKQLHASHNRLTLAEARVSAKTVRASKDGTISDIRVRTGQPLQPGEPIATILQPGADPEIYAFLPSKDRPRLRKDQKLQVELLGYTKARERATITYVGTEAIGANEAAKTLGQTLADALKLPPGSYVLVKAKLPKRTFKTEHNTLNYHHGMLTKTEVKISEKPFLVTLLPALEKYLPE